MAADSDVKRSLILDSRPHIITMCREKNEGKESKHDVSVPVDNQEKISSRSIKQDPNATLFLVSDDLKNDN